MDKIHITFITTLIERTEQYNADTASCTFKERVIHAKELFKYLANCKYDWKNKVPTLYNVIYNQIVHGLPNTCGIVTASIFGGILGINDTCCRAFVDCEIDVTHYTPGKRRCLRKCIENSSSLCSQHNKIYKKRRKIVFKTLAPSGIGNDVIQKIFDMSTTF
jgi:hypothetical protein